MRLLILTGQRRSEISSIRPEYIKGDLCTLPATLTKNKMEHAFPLENLGVIPKDYHVSILLPDERQIYEALQRMVERKKGT